jgi:signal transduction histidine kinase
MLTRTAGIQRKIAIPFTLLLVVAMVVVAFAAISLISRSLEDRLRVQIDRASEMLSTTGFAVNASILGKLKLIVGGEVVTYTRDGQVVAATLDEATTSAFLPVIESRDATERLFRLGEPLVLEDVRFRGVPYTIAYRRLLSPPDTVVALAVPTADVAAATRRIARTIGILAVVTIAVMVVVSSVITRSITSPIKELVAFTNAVAAGDRSQRIRNASRDEIGALGAAFDDMVRRLQASEDELLRSEKLALAGHLAARVAHDVRNPLSSMKMQAQLLRTKILPGQDNADLLARLIREIDRVEWVVEGLLDLARPPELRLVPTEVNAIVTDALRSTEAQLRHRKVTIESRLAAALPAVPADAERLAMALVNLVMNAADAMPDGGTLTARTAAAGDAVRIEIADTGVGIDPAALDQVFDPFFSTKREGVGLGLVNTKTIVELHGGSVELVPGEGRGTRAILTLPAVCGHATARA